MSQVQLAKVACRPDNSVMRAIDDAPLVGTHFGKWLVLGVGRRDGRRSWIVCRCECGETKTVLRDNLLAGKSSSCRKCSGRVGEKNHRWVGYKSIPGHFFSLARKCAEVRGIPFELTIEQVNDLWISSHGSCALSGAKITLGGKKSGYTASLDRISSKVGYVTGNVQFVHKDINLMKNHFDQDYFVEMCCRVAEGCGMA